MLGVTGFAGDKPHFATVHPKALEKGANLRRTALDAGEGRNFGLRLTDGTGGMLLKIRFQGLGMRIERTRLPPVVKLFERLNAALLILTSVLD